MTNLDENQEDKIVIEIHHYHHHSDKVSQTTSKTSDIPKYGYPPPPPPPSGRPQPHIVNEGCAIYLLVGAMGLAGTVLTII